MLLQGAVRPSRTTSFEAEHLNNPEKTEALAGIGTPVLVSEEETQVFRGSEFSLKNTRPADLIADSNHSMTEGQLEHG